MSHTAGPVRILRFMPSILSHAVQFPDGTSSAPSIAFSTDPGMGQWLDTTNDLIGSSGLSVLGRILQTALATPGSITVTPTGTTGATTYTYKLVALSGAGVTPAGAASSTTTGNATLSATNYNALSWTQVAGATGYRIYRTVGGATTGLIATIAAGATVSVDDTGLAGGGETAPTADTTGQFLFVDGLASAPGLALGSAPTTGFYNSGSGVISMTRLGTQIYSFGASTFGIISTSGALSIGSDTILARDAANVLALRNGNNNQTMRFGTMNAAYAQISAVSELHTLAAAATSDTTITIPADALVVGVTVRVTTTITASAGTTFDIGVAGATTRYNPGAGAPVFAAGTTGVSPGTTNPTIYGTAAAIRFTCGGAGSFTAGVVRVTVHYISLSAATS